MSALRWAESILLQLPMRVGLGGLFAYAALQKINNIQAFTFAIKGFHVLDPAQHGQLIISAAYTIPWIEMIAGVLLILGFKSRASATALGLMLIVFIAGLLHVIFDPSIDADCSCFGDKNLYCDSVVGWCQVIRDLILLLPAIYLVWRGGGILGLDSLFGSDECHKKPNSDSKSVESVDDLGIRA